jgi:uncharacterized membrane protein YgdD (TMEM256/DUF423 family)
VIESAKAPNWRALGAGLMLLGVAAGAFGAHGLRDVVEPDLLSAWKTGANYHLVHALALFTLGSWQRTPALGGWLLVAGIVLFSGSLYAMTLTGVRIFGAITPIGGLSFMAGWAALAVAATKDTGEPEQ